MCGNDYITVDQLRAKAKEFIANPYNEDTKPEKISKNVPFFGTVQVTEGHVISLRCDRGSSYKAYMSVQNELVAAYNELRDELAQEKWQKNYMELDQEQQGEDKVRQRRSVQRRHSTFTSLIKFSHYFFSPYFLGSASEIF